MPINRAIAAGGAGLALVVESLVGGLTAIGGIVLDAVPMDGIAGVALIGVFAVGALVVGSFVGEATGRESAFSDFTAIVQAAAAIALVGVLFAMFEPREVVMWAVFAVPVIAFGWIMWQYFGYRQNVGRSAAVGRTRRQTERTFRNWGEFVFGFVAVFVAAILAVMSGALSAGSGLGDAIAPFLGELTYLVTVLLGYLALGGDVAGWSSDLLSSLSPATWAGLVLLVGGIAVAFRS